MFPSKEQRFQRWAVTRAKGRRRFVLHSGVLGWGLATCISWLALMWLRGAMLHPAIQIPVAIVVFPFGGVLWGLIVWHLSEKAYLLHEQAIS